MRWLTSLPPVMDAVSESATVKPNSNASTPPLVVDLTPWWTRVQLAVSHGRRILLQRSNLFRIGAKREPDSELRGTAANLFACLLVLVR